MRIVTAAAIDQVQRFLETIIYRNETSEDLWTVCGRSVGSNAAIPV